MLDVSLRFIAFDALIATNVLFSSIIQKPLRCLFTRYNPMLRPRTWICRKK